MVRTQQRFEVLGQRLPDRDCLWCAVTQSNEVMERGGPEPQQKPS
jgi:hypothetical protein